MELWQLQQMQALPLEVKIEKSKLRIKEWYEHYDGQVYISFSGGKDSTVLLDLVRSLYPEVKSAFIDTGLEYPEIREFVKTIDNVEWIKPTMNFKDVIEKYGYPIISKEVSETIDQCRKGYPSRMKKLDPNYNSKYNCSRWSFLMDAPFKISNLCCNVMKKHPIKSFEKQTGLNPFIGMMANESMLRKASYLKQGCNAFDAKRPTSNPLGFWTEQDILQYLKKYNITYCSVYGYIRESKSGEELYLTGCKRTGCMFCMFGVHKEKEPNRFQMMKETHPKIYDYCINNLKLGEILDYLNVKY